MEPRGVEPSLDCPPVYRQFLAGGPQRLRLSPTAAALVLGGGLILGLIGPAVVVIVTGGGGLERLSGSAAAVLTALLIAVLAARWLGTRPAVLSGWAYMSMAGVLWEAGSFSAVLSPVAACVAMVAAAWAMVPGRLPVDRRPWLAWTFYAAVGVLLFFAGPAAAASIPVGCLVFLLIGQDVRGLRFFASPTGALILGLSIAAWWAAGGPVFPATYGGAAASLFVQLPVRMFPWTPFVALGILVGLHQGHYATPFWRLLGCWTFVPLGLAAVGLLDERLATDLVLPPLAVVGAAGLWSLVFWCRRGAYIRSSRP